MTACYTSNPAMRFEKYLAKQGRPLVKRIQSPVDGKIYTSIHHNGKIYYEKCLDVVLTKNELRNAVYYYSDNYEAGAIKSKKGNYDEEFNKFLEKD